VAGTTSAELAKASVNQFSNDEGERKRARELWRACEAAHVVLVDDIDKAEFTRRFSSDLFTLIEHRTAWQKPLLVTTNLRSWELEEALGRRGAPILRRIKEFCECVTV
jgi:DNA replication protein DnaC